MLQGYNESRLKSWFRKFYGRYIMTLFAITNYHCPTFWMMCFVQFINDIPILVLTTCNPLYLILTKGSRRVWPVSRGCLLLLGTWSYLSICRRSVLPYTRFVIAFWIMVTFYIVNFAILYIKCTEVISIQNLEDKGKWI
jgi:hypothetical protein